MITLQRPHETRPVRFVEMWEHAGWRMKVYSVAYRRPRARERLIDAMKRCATGVIPEPAVDERRYGVGFVYAHDGATGCFGAVNWWQDVTDLQHRSFLTTDTSDPDSLRLAPVDELQVCVWDLAVMAHERDAWYDAVLTNPQGPDLEAYVQRRLDADV